MSAYDLSSGENGVAERGVGSLPDLGEKFNTDRKRRPQSLRPNCRFAFGPFDRYVASCFGAPPLPLAAPSAFIEPCFPTLGHAVPTGSQWAYEIKHDGFRFICRREGERVCVCSRRGHDWTERVPAITAALAALRVKSITLDGEGVVCDANGVSDFDRLRAAVGRLGSRDAFLYAFDLLEINGTDLRRDAWHVRRATLASLLRKAGKGIRLSEHIDGADGEAVFQHACAMGLEGIVAKRRDRSYRSGRSPDWIKVKNRDAPAATRVIEG
jgi:ATP-dependent DNA ligase